MPRFCRLLAITRILSLFETKTINFEQKYTRKSAGRIWPMIHFALKKCSQVGSLSELKSCPSLGEKPTCVARCFRDVKNTMKHPAQVYHIDIMKVNPISGHFGALEAKKRVHFSQKKHNFGPVKVLSLRKGTRLCHTHNIMTYLSGPHRYCARYPN